MKKNRLICLLLIVGNTIFASFYGGNISYALFYASLLIPIFSLLYTLYVYIRFKLYQRIGRRTLVKGEETDYVFQLENEDFITYQNINVHFFDDKSSINHTEAINSYCLLPGGKEMFETKICCNYRGEYAVGLKSITITDYFYLFQITYPVQTKMKVTVLPRVITISKLSLLSDRQDSKQLLFMKNIEEKEADVEVRKYQKGDQIKRIHWKASARRGELFTRKYNDNPQKGIALILDLQSIKSDELTRVIVEDKIIEGMLAIADYCVRKHILCSVYYDMQQIKKHNVYNRIDFEQLYLDTVKLYFRSKSDVASVLSYSLYQSINLEFFIIFTAEISYELYNECKSARNYGKEITIMYCMTSNLSQEQELLQVMEADGIKVVCVEQNQEIEKYLGVG